MEKIINIQLNLLQKKLDVHKIKIKLDRTAQDLISNLGYDNKFGARPLKRVIQKKLKDQLASLILEGKIKEGTTVTASTNDQEIIFNY